MSSARTLFSDRELNDLLSKSRQNNSAAGITGMLLYKDGNFLQCLEGPKEAVSTLELKIKADPRHKGMLVLLQEEEVEPEFKEWAMAFVRIDPDTPVVVSGYSDFLNGQLTADHLQTDPSQSLRLLRSFKKSMR